MRLKRLLLPLAAVVFPVLAVAGPVNVNTADAVKISTELKGIGLAKAEAIVEYRKKHGPFRNADELSLVKGIGERTVDANRSDIKTTVEKQ